MAKMKDLTGKVFNRLTVIELSGKVGIRYQWKCKCECGVIVTVSSISLVTNNTKSCGCLNTEKRLNSNVTHGETKRRKVSKEYRAWNSIKSRCYNKNVDRYSKYGGRGISMCSQWLSSFETFLSDMGKAPSPYHSIDRINVDGNYEPGNCRWATEAEQKNNTTKNIVLIHNGVKATLKEWSEKIGISYAKIRWAYYQKKQSISDIITQQGSG